MATEPRVNDRIRIPKVRVVGFDGQQVGVMETQRALVMAQDQDLDLVEVAPQADPPVARIMDYGKYKYEQAVRQRESRKRQTQVTVKEMKMRPKIDPHDYATKKGHVERFLRQGSKVKVTIMFRGREIAHTELGRKLLDALSKDLEGIAKIESFPKQVDARNMTMVLGPVKEAITQKPATEPRRPKERQLGEDEQSSGEDRAEEGRAEEGRAEEGRAEEGRAVDEERAETAPDARRRPLKVTRAEGG